MTKGLVAPCAWKVKTGSTGKAAGRSTSRYSTGRGRASCVTSFPYESFSCKNKGANQRPGHAEMLTGGGYVHHINDKRKRLNLASQLAATIAVGRVKPPPAVNSDIRVTGHFWQFVKSLCQSRQVRFVSVKAERAHHMISHDNVPPVIRSCHGQGRSQGWAQGPPQRRHVHNSIGPSWLRRARPKNDIQPEQAFSFRF